MEGWLKFEGDPVRAGEVVAVVECDTIVWEIPAPADGTLAVILLPPKLWRSVGTVIGIISTADDDPAAIRRRYPGRPPCHPDR